MIRKIVRYFVKEFLDVLAERLFDAEASPETEECLPCGRCVESGCERDPGLC